MDVADQLVGWTWIGCGLVSWHGRGAVRTGLLMVATGAAWFLGDVATSLLYVHRGPLVHALLSFPSGRLSRGPPRAVAGVAYLDGAIEPVARSEPVTIALCVLVAVAAAEGWLRETGVRRRARSASSGGAVLVAVVLGIGAVGRRAGWEIDTATLWTYDIVLIGIALGLATDLVRGRWSTSVLTGLVVDLGGLWEPETLRARLARALGDRSLELGYWVGDHYADEAGRPLGLPASGSGRAVTPIEQDGERVAVLVHDPAVLQNSELVDAATTATRIAVTNARLQAQVRARVEQVAASRRRIVEAADAQRRRLARELHEGAERRLAAVAEHLEALAHDSGARSELADAQRQLDAARAELGELARGIRPASLTNGGLGVALEELATRASVPVDVDIECGRLPAAVEAAAYFVCAEALANVAKYARASRVRIEARADTRVLVLVVEDDGAGGADPSRGSGLRGLADRVEALGGRLSVESPPGRGTRVAAELPSARVR